jgi:predicted naringenin-chalcone synthase
MSVVISNFNIHQPSNEVEQDKVSHWMAKIQSIATPDTFDERIIQKFSVKKDKISKRSFFCKDFGNMDTSENELFTEENNFSPNLKERSEFYQKTVDGVFNDFFKDEEDAPGEILHVSCTGYVSPSAGQKIIPKNQWSDITGITHMYHMGCYAAMPAIKVAKGMTDKKRIDIVHTEICSNHFDVKAQSPEQMVVQTLFADGAVKYSVYPDFPKDGPKDQSGISVIKMKEKIIPGSEEAMTWGFGLTNLEMTLHRKVPSLINQNLKAYTEELFKSCGMDFEKDKDSTVFAIHPGGPKIIQQIVSLLDLTEEQVALSNSVLKERGNMSSATLPHVWKKIAEDKNIKKGTKIFSVAFGPGLTVAGFIGEKV